MATILLTAAISAGAYVNYRQERDIDRSKVPPKLELSKPFQKWITNLKNKGLIVEADEFRLREENEIYNTKWMAVYNIDDADAVDRLNAELAALQNEKKVAFSPSERELIDYRTTQVRYYGLRDDKIVDARLLGCTSNINCYFDRAYFLDNDVFVVSEFSRSVDLNEQNPQACTLDQMCKYSIKIHLVDLNKNSRLVYESKPFDTNLALLIPNL